MPKVNMDHLIFSNIKCGVAERERDAGSGVAIKVSNTTISNLGKQEN